MRSTRSDSCRLVLLLQSAVVEGAEGGPLLGGFPHGVERDERHLVALTGPTRGPRVTVHPGQTTEDAAKPTVARMSETMLGEERGFTAERGAGDGEGVDVRLEVVECSPERKTPPLEACSFGLPPAPVVPRLNVELKAPNPETSVRPRSHCAQSNDGKVTATAGRCNQ
jgi:hypothetical protein